MYKLFTIFSSHICNRNEINVEKKVLVFDIDYKSIRGHRNDIDLMEVLIKEAILRDFNGIGFRSVFDLLFD